ncbi:MAG: hypothetical protein JXQ67_06385 [Campylobacterales bacterium]|nr:hypothetical protein [Campylobacterales bacterium]
MKYIISIVALLTLLMSGCGSKEGIKTAEHKAYLYFTGNTSGAVVSIDGGEDFSVKPGQNNQYGIKPGKHLIEVKRDGALVVKREIYVGDGIAKEIEVQ